MSRNVRAIIFDLDDTLYPLRRFVRSGFVAVAGELERAYGIDSRKALNVMTAAMRGETRGRELQACIDRFRLPQAIVGDLVNIIRLHQPAIRLPRVCIALGGGAHVLALAGDISREIARRVPHVEIVAAAGFSTRGRKPALARGRWISVTDGLAGELSRARHVRLRDPDPWRR